MSDFEFRALAGVCAFMGAVGLGHSAHALTAISGGGSTLLAPYWGEAARCFDRDAANRSYDLKGVPVAVLTAATIPSSCPNNIGSVIQYDGTGSGTGQAGLFAHAAVISDPAEGLMFGSTDASGLDPVYPSIQYGLSEDSLSGPDLAVYDAGTGSSITTSFFGDSASYAAPLTYQGLTFDAAGTPTGGASGLDYPVAKPLYGALVQFPVAIAPIAIVFNLPNFTATLRLDKNAYCKIFTGQIVNWNDSALVMLNGPMPNLPIKMVGRSDSAGDTAVFTRHLATVCGSVDYDSGKPTLPLAVTNPLPSSGFVAGLFNTYIGSVGVAATVQATPGAIAYIGADYAVPASTNIGSTPGFSLPAAALQNSAGNFELPTGATALAAFGSLPPPQSNSAGAFDATIVTSDRRDPTQWVQSMAAGVPLANPAGPGAYPITGTTNFIGYTCYANAAQLSTLESFLNFNMGALASSALNGAGLAQMPGAWLEAIQNTFLSSTGDAASLNLFLAVASAGSTNPDCSAPSVVGG